MSQLKTASDESRRGMPPGLPDNEDVRVPAELMYRIHALSRMISTYFDTMVEQHGITRAQWTALMYVHHMPGATQSALADSMQMGRAALGKMMDRLESKGLVLRRADATDQRVRRVYPVPSSAALSDFMPDAENALYSAFFGDMSRDEMNALNEALGMMHANGLAAMDEGDS